jgi:hypothetical protein
MKHLFGNLRRTSGIFALLLVSALVLAIAPVSGQAEQHTTSDIERFQPITISESTLFDLEALIEDVDPLTLVLIWMELQDIGEFDTNLTEENLRELDNLDELDRHVPGGFVLPDTLPAGVDRGQQHIVALDGGYAEVTFDVAKVRRISQLLDLPTDWLPRASEQSHLTIRVDIADAGGVMWKNRDGMLLIAKSEKPEFDIPDELDLEGLRDALIDDPRMPDELADQLGAIDDWERTVPVPVPADAEYREVTINGGAGLIVSMSDDMFDGSVLIWDDNGTLNVIAGSFDDETLIDLAESMR